MSARACSQVAPKKTLIQHVFLQKNQDAHEDQLVQAKDSCHESNLLNHWVQQESLFLHLAPQNALLADEKQWLEYHLQLPPKQQVQMPLRVLWKEKDEHLHNGNTVEGLHHLPLRQNALEKQTALKQFVLHTNLVTFLLPQSLNANDSLSDVQ